MTCTRAQQRAEQTKLALASGISTLAAVISEGGIVIGSEGGVIISAPIAAPIAIAAVGVTGGIIAYNAMHGGPEKSTEKDTASPSGGSKSPQEQSAQNSSNTPHAGSGSGSGSGYPGNQPTEISGAIKTEMESFAKSAEETAQAECDAIRQSIMNRKHKITPIEQARKLGFRGEKIDCLDKFNKATGQIGFNTECYGGMEKIKQMFDSVKKEFSDRGFLKKEIELLKNGGTRIRHSFKDGSSVQLRTLGKSGHPKVDIIDVLKNIEEKITFK